MQRQPRRAFALVAATALGTACSGPRPAPTRAEPPAMLGIAPLEAEVWARDAVVSGVADADLAGCRVRSNGRDVAAQIDGARWSARVPVASGHNAVDVSCRDARGREHRAPVARLEGMLRAPRRPHRAPVGRAARDAVVYGVVPPLYGTPPLRAVMEALPDLEELGVDVLWLAPLAENAPDDYGYAVTNYLRLRADYGTEDDLRALVDAAHRRGMRVVLDFVPNHTSTRHRYFEEASALGAASHYWSFFDRDERGTPKHYFDWTHLANLAFDNHEVARWMSETGRRWMEDTGVDGYRIDVAWGIRERTPGFFDDLVHELRRSDPRALLIAEASARDPFWEERGFDAAYDWTDAPGEWSWTDVFGADDVADRLDATVRRAGPGVLRFLENNDTGERFVTRHGPGMTRAASAALLTLPGVPLLFTGQERGAEYEPYGRSAPLGREDPHGLFGHYRALVALRHRLDALRSDGYALVDVTPADPRVLAFRRGGGPGEGDPALVVVRFDGKGGRVRVAIPEGLASARWTDALGGGSVRAANGALDVELAPWAARVLVPAR